MQKLSNNEIEVIDYFNEVALKGEFLESPNRVIKWKDNMNLYISKDSENIEQVLFIKDVIKKINQLTGKEFRINITEGISNSNALIYLSNRKTLMEIDPLIFEGIEGEVNGLTEVEWSYDSYIIDKAKIFIDSEESLEIQKSTILEELTQSIGLLNDSDKYKNSVFYQNKSELGTINLDYSELDKEIIKLLYNPKIKAGMNAKQSDKIIKNIFKERKTKNNNF